MVQLHSSLAFPSSPCRATFDCLGFSSFVLLKEVAGNKFPTGEDSFHFAVLFGDSHQHGAVDVMDEKSREDKHHQEMHETYPLDVDEARNPSHQEAQNRAALDHTEEHQPGEELDGNESENAHVGDCGERVVAYFVEGLATPEPVIRHHAPEACPLARGERQPRSPLCP